jgi:hypothetical protein
MATGLPSLAVTGRARDILFALSEVATTQNPEFLQTPVGTLKVGISAENKAGSVLSNLYQNGHYYKGVIKYIPRATISEVSNDTSCDFGTEDEYLTEDFVLDIYKEIDITLSLDTVRVLELSASQAQSGLGLPADAMIKMREFNERFLRKTNAIRTALNKSVVDTIYSGGFGAFYGGSTTQKDVDVIHAGATGIVGGAPVYEGLQTILSDCSDIEMVGTPYIIGKGNFEKFARLSNYTGLQNSGIDGSFNSNYMFEVDKYVDTKGANDIIVAGKGAFQVFTYNKYAGNLGFNIGNAQAFTIPDPIVPNLTWDAKLEFLSCGEKFNLKLSVNAGVWIQPTEAFGYGDTLAGVNHLLSYKATLAS